MGIRGPKSGFNEQLAERMRKLYAEGKTDEEVARKIGVSVRTIYNWKGREPETFQALKDAKDVADELVEASLFERAVGYTHVEEKIFQFQGQIIRAKTRKFYPPDPVAGIFWLTNRQPDRWKRNHPTAEAAPVQPPPFARRHKTFAEFCVDAGYPAPFAKQEEMRAFMLDCPESVPRMVLGARGYGKTDYITILGVGFKIYQDNSFRVLILTKSKERNAAIVEEIRKALELNGVEFEKENTSLLRVKGLKGKDHSVSAVTIKAVSLRGRHPDFTLLDDPVTEDDTSEATRKLVEKKWNEILKLSQNAGLIGQPAHKFDLYAKLRGLIKIMEVPHGMIPELDHDLEAQRLAGVDEASIQASYFLRIENEGETPFDNIKYLDYFPTTGTCVAFIDPSHEGGDFTAMSILRQHGQGVAVVGFAWKRAWNHCLEEIVQALQKYGVGKAAFETNGVGQQPVVMLNSLLTSKGVPCGIIGRRSNSNKHSRILAAGTFAHVIHLSRESSKTYTDQVVQYEYKAKNDDAPDSLASCLEWLGYIRGKE